MAFLNGNDCVLDVSGLSKSYGSKIAFEGVSFKLMPSEILAVIGDNGAGKSTLLQVLAGEMIPNSGDVLLHGKSIIERREHAVFKIAYVPQGIMLNMNLSTKDTLNFWAAVNKLDKRAAKSECERIISLLKLEPFLKTKIKNLSAGTQRRNCPTSVSDTTGTTVTLSVCRAQSPCSILRYALSRTTVKRLLCGRV